LLREAMNYLILKTVTPDGTCRLTNIKNVPEDERLKVGDPVPEGLPDDAHFKMDDSFPNDVRLADSLNNLSSVLVASEKLKAALEAVPDALAQNEVLPVKIVNHKGRIEKAPYFIIHQVDYPACIDEKKSVGKRARLNTARFQFMTEMVLDPSLIPPPLLLFRPAQYRRLPLVRRDLAESLGKLGLTGVEFHEIAGYEF
jgi:hypothetical protein